MSEFGACMGSDKCAMEITTFTEACDEHLAGWAYWQFKKFEDLTTSAGTQSEGFYNSDGSLQEIKVKALSRTYLQATQGLIGTMRFNSEIGRFVANVQINTKINAPTILYYNQQYYYQNGYNLLLLGEDGKQVDDKYFIIDETVKNFIKILMTPEYSGEGNIAFIQIILTP